MGNEASAQGSSAMQTMGQHAQYVGNTMRTLPANMTMANASQMMATGKDNMTTFVQQSVTNHSVTIDALKKATQAFKPAQVKSILDQGVNPNLPIDKEGHTVLDMFALEHQKLLEQIINMRGSPEEKTHIFYTNQEMARQVLVLLTDAGAKMSSPETSRNRVPWVP
mmetsp:Transcript_71156/g.123439  ORF Transcript_71156/g.123439 Transcript_71156/m.123439 type:complete len:166 (-) Transcript_71156:166-663(-)